MKHLDYRHPNFDIALLQETFHGKVPFLNNWFNNLSKGRFFVVNSREAQVYCDPKKQEKLKKLNERILKSTSILFYLSQSVDSPTANWHTPPGFYNIDYLIFLINQSYITSGSQLSKLQIKFVDKVIYFLLHHSNCNLKLKLSYLKIFIEFAKIRSHIFAKYWITKSNDSMNSTIIGNLLLTETFEDHFLFIVDFFQYLHEGYPQALSNVLTNFVDINVNNNKMNSILQLTRFSHFKILIRLTTVMHEVSTRLKESTVHEKNYSTLTAPFIQFAVQYFTTSVIPLIYYLNYEKKNLRLLQSVIRIESSSIRWNDRPSSKQSFLAQKKRSLDLLTRCVKKNEEYISGLFIRSCLLRFVNSICNLFLQQIPYGEKFLSLHSVPNDILQNLVIYLTYNYDTIQDNSLGCFPGLDTWSIKKFSILCLNSEDWGLTHDNKRKLIQFYSTNCHIFKNDFIQNKLNSRVFITQCLDFYCRLQKERDETSTLCKDKLIIRDNILDIWLHLLLHNSSVEASLFISFYTIKLKSVFMESAASPNVACLCIMDLQTVIERMIHSALYIKNFPDLMRQTFVLKKKLRNEDMLYKKIGCLQQDVLLIKNALLFLEFGFTHFSTVFSTPILIPKIAMCLNFFLHKMQNFRSASVFTYFNYTIDLKILFEHFISFSRVMRNNQEFCEAIVDDPSNHFSTTNFELLTGQVEQSYGQDSVEFQECQQLFSTIVRLSDIKQTQTEQDALNGFTAAIPDKYCDPIMMTPIVEPYILPDSQLFTEKNTIISHLHVNEIDPFNRVPLTIKALHEYNQRPEIQSKLTQFKDEFALWKQAHKISSQLENSTSTPAVE